MLTLMLDPRFKSLHLVSSFIDCEHGEVIVEEYDINFVFYATLIELKINLLTKKWIIGFFEIVARTSEPTKKTLVKKNAQVFSNGCYKNQMPSSVVGKARGHIFHNCISCF